MDGLYPYHYRLWSGVPGPSLTFAERTGGPVLVLDPGVESALHELRHRGVDTDGWNRGPHHLQLPRTYTTVVAVTNALQVVGHPADTAAGLERVLRHLRPGGTFAVPFCVPWRPGEPLDTGWRTLYDREAFDDGATVRCDSREVFEPGTRQWRAEQRYEIAVWGIGEHQSHQTSGYWFEQAEAVDLFAAAGFTDVACLRGFDGGPAQPDDRTFVVLARRPATDG